MPNMINRLLFSMMLILAGIYAQADESRILSDSAGTGTGKEMASSVPRFDIRALHLQLMRSRGPGDPVKQSKQDVLSTISRASRSGFNVLILMIDGSVQLKNTPRFATQWAYSQNDIKEIIQAARSSGMEVIPEIKLLTHQENTMKHINEALMLNEGDYDPNKKDVYPIVYGILDEIVELFHPRFVHIGHDEVYGIQKAVYPKSLGFRILTPDEFLADVLRIHQYLKKKNIQTLMWSDALLDPAVLRTMYKTEMNAYKDFTALIDRIPHDIILTDGHYILRGSKEFASYTYLQNKGFIVWGAAWKDPGTIQAFSEYIGLHARKGEGMIATIWWPFVSQKKEVINVILEVSSKAFFIGVPRE